jgi:nucleoid-associated protein YgaU
MTRETKIGLLVGLAFIIVIGILLSEHVSSTNEPQQASLNGAGANVRDGVVSPGAADDAPPITIAGTPVESPRQTVPTNVDLHPPAPPVAYVPTGGPGRATPRRGAGFNGTLAAGIDGNPSPAPGNGAASPGDLVQQHPDVLAYDPNESAPPRATPARQAPATPPATYVAVAGDSVSRIAGRLMGGNTRTNRDLLIRANPTLQNEGNVVVIGRTYVVPRASAAPSGQASPDVRFASAQPAPHGPDSTDSAARLAEQARWYTVKGDDNLWRIAESQLGSGTAWTQIRDLNKDVLKGGETVRANMRLRLPAKTAVAGAD